MDGHWDRTTATSLGAADGGEDGSARGIAGRGRGRLEDTAHSYVHALPAPMQLGTCVARGGEGEGSGSAAVKKEDEETESMGDGLPNRSHEQ